MSNAGLVRAILRNDLRLFWRTGAARPIAFLRTVLMRLFVLAMLHVVVHVMLQPHAATPLRGGAELAALWVLLLLAMTAVHRSLEVLFDRGDLQLLLASPVPPRIVLLTRLLDIAITSLLGTVFVAVPFVDVAAVMFGPHWLFGFPTWIATTLLVAPIAIAVTTTAVAVLGFRRARLAVQLLGVGIGLLGVGAAQLPQLFSLRAAYADGRVVPADTAAEVFAWFDVGPLRAIVAAARGDWQLFPLLLAAAGLGWVGAFALLSRHFLHSAQGAFTDGGETTTPRRDDGSEWRGTFAHGSFRTQVRTQLVLLRRDPLLLMRCALQIVSLVPMLFTALMLERGAGLGGVGLMAAAIVPITLAALLNADDAAADLAGSSPARPQQLALARAITAAAPLLVFGWAMAVLAAWLANPWCGVLVAVGSTVNAVAAGWLGTCTTRIHTAEERARRRPPRIAWQTLLGMVIAGLGTAGIGCIDKGEILLGAFLFAGDLTFALGLFVLPPRQLAS